MTPYQVDGIDLDPQPNDHEWRYPNVLGNDASGSPFYAKFAQAMLRTDLTVGYHEWLQWMDGAHHTVTLPAPGTVDDWTDYASVYVQVVEQGRVAGSPHGRGMQGVEMQLVGVEV